MTTDQPRNAFPQIRWRTTLPMLVLLGFGVYALLPRLTTLNATTAGIRTLRWWPLALAAIAQLASYCANGYAVRAVARLAGDKLPLATAAAIAVAAGSVGLLTGGPVGYAAATRHWMRRRDHSEEAAILCGWLPGLLNITSLIVLSFAGFVALLVQHALTHAEVVALALPSLCVIAVVALTAWVLSDVRRLPAIAAGTRRLWRRLWRKPKDERAARQMVKRMIAAQRMLHDRGWLVPMAGALANASFDVLTLYVLFLATGSAPNIAVLLAGYGLPQVIGHLSFLPGGLGIVEGGMTGMYVALGVRAPIAALVVLAYRGFSFWLPTLIGLPTAFILQRATAAPRA